MEDIEETLMAFWRWKIKYNSRNKIIMNGKTHYMLQKVDNLEIMTTETTQN